MKEDGQVGPRIFLYVSIVSLRVGPKRGGEVEPRTLRTIEN